MSETNKKNQSPARKLLQILWDNRMDGTGWSYERLNQGMRSALHLAITMGMKFDPDDFVEMRKDFRGSRWFITDNDHSQGEGFYAAAAEVGNLSACQSFEKWKNRQPFMYEGKRLYHGAIVRWQGETCAVTSFSEDGSYLTICSYKSPPHRSRYSDRTYFTGKIKKRYKVTLVELRAIENEKRKAKKATKAKGVTE